MNITALVHTRPYKRSFTELPTRFLAGKTCPKFLKPIELVVPVNRELMSDHPARCIGNPAALAHAQNKLQVKPVTELDSRSVPQN